MSDEERLEQLGKLRAAEIEMMLRREWWVNHGHHGIYGDDGEMQCGECRVDYKRDPLQRCETAMKAARLKRGVRAMAEVERAVAYREALRLCGERYAEMAYTGMHEYDLAPFIQEFRDKLGDHPINKMNRWLGYIQGALVERGATTVLAERDWTRKLFRPLDFPIL